MLTDPGRRMLRVRSAARALTTDQQRMATLLVVMVPVIVVVIRAGSAAGPPTTDSSTSGTSIRSGTATVRSSTPESGSMRSPVRCGSASSSSWTSSSRCASNGSLSCPVWCSPPPASCSPPQAHRVSGDTSSGTVRRFQQDCSSSPRCLLFGTSRPRGSTTLWASRGWGRPGGRCAGASSHKERDPPAR
jgi:hypothetical protein